MARTKLTKQAARKPTGGEAPTAQQATKGSNNEQK